MRVTLLLAAIGAVVGVMGLAADWSDGLQRQAEDLLQPGTDRSDGIVVVEIDRSTLAAVGESWPWPRSVHAGLVDAITAGGPTAIAYDVLFADERDDDAELIAAVERAPLVLASALTLRDVDGPPVIVDEVQPADALVAAAAAVGHANVTLTPDRGVVRSLPLYALDERGLVHPALSVAVIATAEGAVSTSSAPTGSRSALGSSRSKTGRSGSTGRRASGSGRTTMPWSCPPSMCSTVVSGPTCSPTGSSSSG